MGREITIGKVLIARREELGSFRKDIYKGICSHTAYLRYEKDERIPSKCVCDIFFQRLGLDSFRMEYVRPDGEEKTRYDEVIKKQRILYKIANEQYELQNVKEAMGKLVAAWNLTRDEEMIDVYFQKILLSDIESIILYKYILYTDDILQRKEHLYNYWNFFKRIPLNSYKKRILFEVLLELIKIEEKDNNVGNSNQIGKLITEYAINNYNIELLQKLYAIDKYEINVDQRYLFEILKYTDSNGLIDERGLRFWESIEKQKL